LVIQSSSLKKIKNKIKTIQIFTDCKWYN